MNTYRLLLLLAVLSPGPAAAFTVTEAAKLTASDEAEGDRFGFSASISDEAVLIGASGAEAAYIFKRTSEGIWQQQAKLVSDDNQPGFGRSVTLQGDTAVVGATYYGEGAVYVFTQDSDGQWFQQAKLFDDTIPSYADFGSALALEDNTLVIGARLSGYLYVYDRDENGVWTLTAKLQPSDYFSHLEEPILGPDFGHTVAFDGDTIIAGFEYYSEWGYSGPDYLAVYAFERDDNGAWQETANIKLDGAWSVALDGDTALFAPGVTNVYVYARDTGGQWVQETTLAASGSLFDDYFGDKVSIFGNTALVAAPGDDEAANDAGAVHLFSKSWSGIWRQQDKLLPSNAVAGQRFGDAVAIDNNLVVIGASGANDESGAKTGAAYIFELPVIPQCNGRDATIFVRKGKIVGGPMDGEKYQGELIGTSQDDVMFGTPYKDLIKGLGGNDLICGDSGQDLVFGGNGNDLLLGGDGRDIVKGQNGDDRLFGNRGDDILYGGDGNDFLRGGWDYDRCIQGESNIGCEIVRE